MNFQHYWRCAHHPSCIENFFESRQRCEWDCHTTALHSTDSGYHRPPLSWGGHGSRQDFEMHHGV